MQYLCIYTLEYITYQFTVPALVALTLALTELYDSERKNDEKR